MLWLVAAGGAAGSVARVLLGGAIGVVTLLAHSWWRLATSLQTQNLT